MKVREVSFDFQSINSIRKNKEIRFDELIPDWAIKWLQHLKKKFKNCSSCIFKYAVKHQFMNLLAAFNQV